MKKYILFMAMLFVASCHTQKKVTENISQKQQAETNVSKDTKITENGSAVDLSSVKTDSSGLKALQLIERLTQDFEAKLKTYDPDKPLDPVSGKPPLVSELEIRNKTSSDKNTTSSQSSDTKTNLQKNLQTDWNKVINSRIDSAMEANSKTITDTELVEKQSGWPWWLFVLIGAALTILIYFAVKRKWYKCLLFP